VSRLPDPIGSVLERDEDEHRLHRNWEGTRARMAARERPRHDRRVRVAAIGLAFATAALVAFVAWPRAAEGPLLTEAGGLPVAAESVARPRTLRFDDGSAIELASGARVVPRANDTRRFELVLERGRTRFEVMPGGARAWTIDAGIATVHVVGTAFVVERDERTVRVEVERGRVRVEGEAVPNGRRELGAGERIEVHVEQTSASRSDDAADATNHLLDFSSERGSASESAAIGSDSDSESAPEGASESGDGSSFEAGGTSMGSSGDSRLPSRGRTTSESNEARAWQTLAERGEHRAAYDALSPSGLERRARAASARELLLLADVARLSGHPADAVVPLRRFLDAHASHPEAPLAAITLARVELTLGRPAAAASAYERAQTLGVPSSFDAEVCAGLALALARSGSLAPAGDAARRCLARHARPPHHEALRRLAENDASEPSPNAPVAEPARTVVDPTPDEPRAADVEP
jgi:transmembrane sensor